MRRRGEGRQSRGSCRREGGGKIRGRGRKKGAREGRREPVAGLVLF